MHMRMEIQAPVMGVQDRALTEFGFKLALAKALNRLRRRCT
jgi:hypothetical protein